MSKDKYKITIISYDFKTSSTAISNRMRAFARALDKECEIHLLTSRGQGEGKHSFEVFFNPQNNKLPFLFRLILDIFYGIILFFYLIFDKKDLYLVSSPPFFSSFLAILALKLKNQKYILDIRDLYPKVFIVNGLIKEAGLLARAASWIEKAMYDGASFISTTTTSMQAHIKAITKSPVEIICNGYDKDVEYSRELGSKIEKIVFLGTLSSYTDSELMLKVFSCLYKARPELRFSIIGDGKVELIKLDFPCEIIKFLPHSEIKNHTLDAQLGVCFLKDNKLTREIFPVKVFEYLGLELIPILNINGVASNILKKHNIGLVSSGLEAKDIASAILGLIDDAEKQQQLLKNIKATKSLFRRESQANKLLLAVKNLLKI